MDSWWLEYRSTHNMSYEDILFLSKFNNVKDFTEYCFWKLSEEYFLTNDKITFEKVLRGLENVQKESEVSNA